MADVEALRTQVIVAALEWRDARLAAVISTLDPNFVKALERLTNAEDSLAQAVAALTPAQEQT